MYLISVYFDEKSNRILQRYIDQISEATGNHFMTDNNMPPHMTISAIEAKNVEELVPILEGLRTDLVGGKIKIVSVGQLLPYVMYATPVLNEYLQNLITTIYDAYKNQSDTTISKYYQPMSWLPHITLGKKLDKDQMQKAFEVMQQSFVPFDATVNEIGLAKVNPHMDVLRFELKSY